MAGGHTAVACGVDSCRGLQLRGVLQPCSLRALQTWPRGPCPCRCTRGELGTPRGITAPWGWLPTPQRTLIRALGPGASCSARIPWAQHDHGDRSWAQHDHGDRLASYGASAQQLPLGFLQRSTGLDLVGVCGGSCLLQMGRSYPRGGAGELHRHPTGGSRTEWLRAVDTGAPLPGFIFIPLVRGCETCGGPL